MTKDFQRARDVYDWGKRFLSLYGAWPLDDINIKFVILIVYIAAHMIMLLIDIYEVFGNMELLVLNFLESSALVMIILKLMVLRFSTSLGKIIVTIYEDLKSEYYESLEEERLYLDYNFIARIFFISCLYIGSSTASLYHLKPLEGCLRAVIRNESQPFVLPYRTRFFFDVNNQQTYWLIFFYQSPIIMVHQFYTQFIGILFSLVLHVCGQLSILALRIRNLNENANSDPRETKIIFRNLVKKHLRIKWMAKTIDDTFSLLLLEELGTMTALIGMSSYAMLTNPAANDLTTFITFVLYDVTCLLILFGYCLGGEYLITESINVHNSYYQCKWYNFSNGFKKQIMISMAAAIKPFTLTAGHFYIFSIAGYTQVIKTSMAYVSMLRTLV